MVNFYFFLFRFFLDLRHWLLKILVLQRSFNLSFFINIYIQLKSRLIFVARECGIRHISCQLNCKVGALELASMLRFFQDCMNGQREKRNCVHVFPARLRSLMTKQVVSQLPIARPLSTCV